MAGHAHLVPGTAFWALVLMWFSMMAATMVPAGGA
jgi:hypothetical protein